MNLTGRSAVAGLGALVACLLAVAVLPDAGWHDAGELSASLFSAGVSHPTGFPLYHPLGKLATLLPVGSIAFRANLLSALFGAGAVALLMSLLLGLAPGGARRGDGVPAAAAALTLLVSGAFWRHAVSVEVYVFNALALALFLAGLLPLLRASAEEGAWLALLRRRLPLLAFGFGLGLGAHVTFPLVAGAAALPLLVLALRRPASRRWLLTRLPVLLLLVGLGALVVAYLPLVAGRDPIRNWGDPSTLGRLWEHLSGARIQRMFAGEMGRWSAAALLAHAGEYLALAWRNLGPLLFAAGAGALWLLRRERALFAATALALLADAAFTIKLNPMGMAEGQTSVPSYLILCLWAGLAFLRVSRALPARPALAGGLAGLLALGLGAPALWPDLSGRVARGEAAALVRQAMNQAPPGALWITSSDSLCALSTYLQSVENHRPDLKALVKQQLWDPHYVASLARPDRGAVVSPGLVSRQAALVAAGRIFEGAAQSELLAEIVGAHEAAGRAVLFEPGDALLDAPLRDRLVPAFPLWHLGQPQDASLADFDARTRGALRLWERSAEGLASAEGRLAVAHFLRIASAEYARRGGEEAARALIERAGLLAPGEPRIDNNLAVLRSRAGDLRGAIGAARQAVAARPDYRPGWTNLGSFHAAAGELADSYAAFAKVARLGASPRERFRIGFDLGRLHAQRGEAALAALWLDLALALDPGHTEARRWRQGLPSD